MIMKTKHILITSVIANVLCVSYIVTNKVPTVETKAPIINATPREKPYIISDTIEVVEATMMENKEIIKVAEPKDVKYLKVHIYKFEDEKHKKHRCDINMKIPANPYSTSGEIHIEDRQTNSSKHFKITGYDFNVLENTLLDENGEYWYINLNNYDQFSYTLEDTSPPVLKYTLYKGKTQLNAKMYKTYYADKISLIKN